MENNQKNALASIIGAFMVADSEYAEIIQTAAEAYKKMTQDTREDLVAELEMLAKDMKHVKTGEGKLCIIEKLEFLRDRISDWGMTDGIQSEK